MAAGRRLLVDPHQGRVQHQTAVVPIFDEIGEELLPNARRHPVTEALVRRLRLSAQGDPTSGFLIVTSKAPCSRIAGCQPPLRPGANAVSGGKGAIRGHGASSSS